MKNHNEIKEPASRLTEVIKEKTDESEVINAMKVPYTDGFMREVLRRVLSIQNSSKEDQHRKIGVLKDAAQGKCLLAIECLISLYTNGIAVTTNLDYVDELRELAEKIRQEKP